MLYIGAMAGSFWRHQKLGMVKGGADVLRKAREYGMEGFQLGVGRELSSLEPRDVAAMRAELEALGLRCCVSAGLIRLLADEPRLRRTFEAARELDAICLCTTWTLGMEARHKKRLDRETVRAHVRADAESTRRVAAFAEEYGVPVAFENHIDYLFEENSEILDDVRSPKVGLMFDTANPLLYLQDPMRYLDRYAGRIFATHLKDAYAVPAADGLKLVWCELGRGVVDIPTIVERLAAQGRPIALNLEFWAQAEMGIPHRTEAFWTHLHLTREETAGVLRRLEADATLGHPAVGPEDDAKGLDEEVRANRGAVSYLGALLDRAATREDGAVGAMGRADTAGEGGNR